jgi:hypothetical protein
MKSGSSGSACSPVIVPVFKTGGRQVSLSPVGSTPTRFRQYLSTTYVANVLRIPKQVVERYLTTKAGRSIQVSGFHRVALSFTSNP